MFNHFDWEEKSWSLKFSCLFDVMYYDMIVLINVKLGIKPGFPEYKTKGLTTEPKSRL